MTEFKRPNCSICSETIEKNESHLGPPFENNTRHMRCAAKCTKCGKENITDLPLHREDCPSK